MLEIDRVVGIMLATIESLGLLERDVEFETAVLLRLVGLTEDVVMLYELSEVTCKEISY